MTLQAVALLKPFSRNVFANCSTFGSALDLTFSLLLEALAYYISLLGIQLRLTFGSPSA